MSRPHSSARRRALQLTALSLTAPALSACAASTPPNRAAPAAVDAAIRDFAALQPDGTHAMVQVDAPRGGWTAGHQTQQRLFIGSAFKTFALAQFLRDAETKHDGIAAQALCTIDDSVRTPGSPVFGELAGRTPWISALEAMMAHSDNIAADLTLARVGPARVRALIAEAGLRQTQIPDSTRKMFSYLAGAPSGTDLGWAGMQRLARDEPVGYTPRKGREAINPHQACVSTAEEMVRWYRDALAGRFFATDATRIEFKRISSMSSALALVVPESLQIYGKGGSLDWEGFHALSVPGQMLVDRVPVNFCFTLNWQGGDLDKVSRLGIFVAAVAKVLAAASAAVLADGPRIA